MVRIWVTSKHGPIVACCVILLSVMGCGGDGEDGRGSLEYMVGRYGGENLTVQYSIFRHGGSEQWQLQYAVFYKGTLSQSLWIDGVLHVYGEYGKESIECELGSQVWIEAGGVVKNIESGARVATYVELAKRGAEDWEEGVEAFEKCQDPREAIEYLERLVGSG